MDKKSRKNMINQYLWEKIEQGEINTEEIAANLEVSRKTIYTYIAKSIERGEIRYIKRGHYELIDKTFSDEYMEVAKDESEDSVIFETKILPYLEELPQNLKNIWQYACSEMINNVIEHSSGRKMHILIKKNILKTTVIISDNGIGIFKKIKEHFSYGSEEEAMHELFKGRLTTDAQNHSGEGIFFTSRIMDKFFAISNGRIFTHNNYEDAYYYIEELEKNKSTTIIMELSNYSKKILSEVFDEFSDEDGKFFKTEILMKNIFSNNYPISRSQAKRLSRHFDKFEEVVLDFDEIEGMGQGFAHELFVVFALKHENIRLRMINANKNVNKMFVHVTTN